MFTGSGYCRQRRRSRQSKTGQRNRDNGRGVDRRIGIEDASEGSETTAEVARIQGQQRRLWRRNDGPEKLATTMEALEEKEYPEESTTTTEVAAEEG